MRILLLGPPAETGELRRALAATGAVVTAIDPFPAWEGSWEWSADPQNTGHDGWAFDERGGWRPIQIGTPWQAQGIQHAGVAWYRRTILIPGAIRLPVCLTLRALEDSAAVFLNGTMIASGGGNWGDLDAPLEGVRPGRHQVAIRVVNPAGSGDPNRGGLAGLVDFSLRCTPDLLRGHEAVVLSSLMPLSGPSAAAVEDYVRGGGVVLTVFYDGGRRWQDTRLERLVPTFLGLSGDMVGAVPPRAVGPLGESVGRGGPPVEVTASIHLPDHPRFARPGTRETAKWQLSPLAWSHGVEVEGTDPKSTPLLTSARYGAGTAVACAAPTLLTAEVLKAILSSERREAAEDPPVGTVWGSVSLPWEHLRLQGVEPAEYEQADLVVFGGAARSSDVRAAVERGKTALLLDPMVVADASDLDPWSPHVAEAPAPVPLVDSTTWATLIEKKLPRVVGLSVPDGARQICIEGERFGAVRAAWSGREMGRQCANGAWVVPPTSQLSVGLWPTAGGVPAVHLGDRAVVVTGSGIRLDEPLSRPALRTARGRILWRWEDGEPALALRQAGEGTVAAFSVPWRGEDPRELDWSDIQGSKARFLHEDTAQLLAIAIRELLSDDMVVGPIDASIEGLRLGLRGEGLRNARVRYRFRDWQRSLVCSREIDLSSHEGSTSFDIPWPSAEESATYESADLASRWWLEVAVMSPHQSRCVFHVEVGVRRPLPAIAVWHTPVFSRPPLGAATWPRLTDPDLPREMGPASQYPLFAPGEEVGLWIESWGASAESERVDAIDLRRGTPVALTQVSSRQSESPWRVSQWRMLPNDPSVYRIRASRGGTTAQTLVIVSPPTDLRSCIWDRGKGVQVLGSLYERGDPRQFALENLCAHADSGLAWGPFARAWPGQPWCDFIPNPFCFLPNGVHYRAWNAETIRSLARHTWTGETLTISASLVDGFNGVPWPSTFLHPQHLGLFARWMRDRGDPSLTGLDADSLAALALGRLNPQWRYFVATEIAMPAHGIMRDEIRSVSPGSHLTDQFDLPLLPTVVRIPSVETFAERWQELFAISSSDAWNVRAGRDYHVPTYLVALGKALAPKARIGHYHMEMLGGLGPERIAKAELIRRQNADLFWMMAASDLGWVPVETYPDGGGVSWIGGWQTWLSLSSRSQRGGHVAFPEDWQVLHALYATAEAVRPRRPRGFVLAAVGPRLPEPGDSEVVVGDQARLFGMLREAGLPIAAMARLDKIGSAAVPEGLIVPVPGALSAGERRGLRFCLDRGLPVGIITMGLPLRAVAAYLGLDPRELAAPHIVIWEGGSIRGPFWGEGSAEDYEAVARFSSSLRNRCAFDIAAPPGVSTYAFDSPEGLTFVLMEERGRALTAQVTIRGLRRPVRAAELLGGSSLTVRQVDKGAVVRVPLRACGAALVQVYDE